MQCGAKEIIASINFRDRRLNAFNPTSVPRRGINRKVPPRKRIKGGVVVNVDRGNSRQLAVRSRLVISKLSPV
jgi:hypothetical protein